MNRFESRKDSFQKSSFTGPSKLEPVRFYSTRGKYGAFSNFSRHPVTIDNIYWPTTEHYYQAKKFTETEPDYALEIQNAPSPKIAAKLGRDRSHTMRPDWNLVNDDVMRVAVGTKVLTYHEIAELLLDTGERIIIEDSPKDYYWGCGADGTGKNMLGHIFMESRELLPKGGAELPMYIQRAAELVRVVRGE